MLLLQQLATMGKHSYIIQNTNIPIATTALMIASGTVKRGVLGCMCCCMCTDNTAPCSTPACVHTSHVGDAVVKVDQLVLEGAWCSHVILVAQLRDTPVVC